MSGIKRRKQTNYVKVAIYKNDVIRFIRVLIILITIGQLLKLFKRCTPMLERNVFDLKLVLFGHCWLIGSDLKIITIFAKSIYILLKT